MPIYKAPVEQALFLLEDVFAQDLGQHSQAFSGLTIDDMRAVLTQAARLGEDVLQPLNLPGDRQGCTRDADGNVTTPKGFKEAYKLYAQGGWIGLAADPTYGGQGLPYTLASIVNEYMGAANMAFTMYPGLTQSAIATISQHASEALKRLYLPRLISGEWCGTMNLTEPHCGTDLGLLKTKAVPREDGSYAITGQKIFISAGEHDLAENIVHLVLARIEGAPPGTAGISLFIAPKRLPDGNGAAGARNAISCGAIERKMGIHANATCVMNYDGATGFLIGAENHGLAAMFLMMNEARLGVANQGLAISEVAYQNAAAYAQTRLQGRALSGAKAPKSPADPIIVHADVRRMLLDISAFNQAARALLIWATLMADVAQRGEDAQERERASGIVSLLTPVLKGVLTDYGFANAVKAQQVFGGHGYIVDAGMEQFVRDARIAMIYEGANGVQALDLVGRKLQKDGGRALRNVLDDIRIFISENASNAALAPCLGPLEESLGRLKQATLWLMRNAPTKPDDAAAAAHDYMHLFGLVALAYMWARIARAALLRKARAPAPRMDAKLDLARYFMARILPETGAHLARIVSGAEVLTTLPDEAF